MSQTSLIATYGSIEAARQRYALLSIDGRALTDEEARELITLQGSGAALLAPMLSDTAITQDPEEWARAKKTKRDVLCVAATHAGWELQPEFNEPSSVTEAEYDTAVETANKIIADAASDKRLDGKGRAGMVVLTLPDQLIGVIARRFDERTAKRVMKELGDENSAISDNALPQAMRSATLWPTGDRLETVRALVPMAFSDVFPSRLMEAAGLSRSKKKR